MANTAWSFAQLAVSDLPLLDAIAAESLPKISAFGTQSISNTALAYAKLYVPNEPLLHALSEAFLRKIDEMESQNLANISWAYATLGFADEQLMQAIAAAAIAKIRAFSSRRPTAGTAETLEFITDLLALSWSLAFSARLTAALADPLRSCIVGLGRDLDRRTSEASPSGADREEGSAASARFPGVPYACVDLPGIMVVFKPENWEVNRGDPEVHRSKVEWRLLSDWLAQALPRERHPLAHSAEFDFGFIHRLDVPSSGLVLTAKNFAGLSLLRFQLDTHELCREYVVVCVNPVDARLRDVSERLSLDRASMRSCVSGAGAPARTFLKSQVHAWPQQDPDNLDTLLVVKILTGRHHQIRAHLTHLQHPAVADGRYGQASVMLRDKELYSDMVWFEGYFHRPVVPLFLESGPNRKTELLPLAGDLLAGPVSPIPEHGDQDLREQ